MDCTAIILTIGIIFVASFFCTYAGDVGKSGGYFCAAVEFGPADDYYVQGARRL